MSRPVGRYFAPLIKKIKALQQEEKIEIDEKFKMEFRAQLLAQASSVESSNGVGVSEVDDDTALEKSEGSFFDKFRRFSMFFAAIPAVLVLVVVAYSINNFSALLKTSEETFSSSDVSLPSKELKSDVNNQYSTSSSSESLEEKKMKEEALIEIPPNSNSQSKLPVHQNNQTISPPASENKSLSPESPANTREVQTPNTMLSTGGGTANLENTASLDTTNATEATNSPSNSTEALSTSTSGNVRSTQDSSASLMKDASEDSSADSSSTEGSSSKYFTNSQSTAFAPSTVTYNTMAPSPTPTVVNPYIYFSGSLNQNQKDYFEKTLVPSLLQGKILEFATVKEKNGLVTVTIYFKDKSRSVSTYIYDTNSNQWVHSQVTNQSTTSQAKQNIQIHEYTIETMPSFEYTKANES